MKTLQLVRIISVTLASVLFLSACGNKDNTWYEGVSGETVATVNGFALKDSELEAISNMRQQSGQPKIPEEKAIEEIINLELLREEAVKLGLHKKPEVALQLNRQTTQLLASNLLRNKLTEIEVTDEEIRQAYEKQVGELPDAEYNSSHILLKTEEEAKDIISELDGGADFATLAKEKSTGPSGANGGSLGWAFPTAFVPAFSNAMQDMEIGAYSKTPVQTQFGWHVILLQDKRSPEAPKLEDIKPQVRQFAMSEKIKAYIDGLREGATIVIAEKPSVAAEAEEK